MWWSHLPCLYNCAVLQFRPFCRWGLEAQRSLPPTENGKLRFQFPTRNFRLPTFAPPHGQNSCRRLTDASRAQFSVRSSLAFWEVFKDNRANQQSDPTCYCLSEKGRRQIQTEQKAYVYWKSHSPSLKSFQKE